MKNLFEGLEGINEDHLLDFCERLERVWIGYKDAPEMHKMLFLMHFMIYITRKSNMSVESFDLLLAKIKELNRLIDKREKEGKKNEVD